MKKAINVYAISKQDYKKKQAWGLTACLDLHDCDKKLITSPKAIKRFIKELCAVIEMKRYGNTIVKRFAEGLLEGYSAVQFIETSSITLHFDDKIKDRAFIDIFSCQYFDQQKAKDFSEKFFNAKCRGIKIFTRC